MSITFDDVWSRAKDAPAFSNGDEGQAFESNWCGRCLHDAPFRNGLTLTGCPILTVAVLGRTPVEWFEQPWQQIQGRPAGETAPSLGDTYRCIEFRAPGSGGGEPQPLPEPTGMDGLFARPERRTRMYVQPDAGVLHDAMPERAR